MKKRSIALLLGFAMVSSLAFAACGGGSGDGTHPSGNVTMEYTEDGTVYNAATAKTYKASRPDPRENAYSAYAADGTKLGDYKTIAAAINSAVAESADTEVFGSYVTKIGDTTKLFVNNEGYGDNNSDCFWYYEDGNKLDAYNCWDNTDTMAMLKNSNYIVHETINYGLNGVQTWNGYGLLDYSGNVITDPNTAAQSWELSSTMDAAMLQFTARLKGITGLDYTIDFSNVKITPAYDGTATYAFMGFYTWQDYYVLCLGLACDTTTGNWYAFEATSRDNSFSDAVYNMGDCIMTSTWNEEGGYFVPDNTEVNMKIQTKMLEDESGSYQVNDLSFEVKDGATYMRRITDSYVNDKFSVVLGPENGYHFVAGLDIKNTVVSGVSTENTDYFNGSKFENLTIKAASAYAPADDEAMNELVFGYPINAEWKGKWHDLVMATEENTEGVMDYTILNTNACVEYQAVNGTDVYSFSYDGEAAAENVLGANAKSYQDKIDALKEVTVDNALDYDALIMEVAEWYGADATGTNSTLAEKWRNVLDFAPYVAARKALEDAAVLSEQGEAVAAEFKKLMSVATYEYKGWEAPEGETIAGYVYSEVLAFRAVEEAYNALSELDKKAIFKHISEDDFEAWAELSAMIEDGDLAVSVNARTEGSNGEAITYTGEEALQEILYWATLIKVGTNWGTTFENANDDPNEGGATVMNSDNNWLPSVHVAYLVHELESEGVVIPLFVEQLLDKIGYTTFDIDYAYLYNVLKLAAGIQNGKVAAITEDVAYAVNTYMMNFNSWTDAGLNWNWNNSGDTPTDFIYRWKHYKAYFGLNIDTNLNEYVKVVTDFLTARGYTGGYTGSGLGTLAEVTAENLTVSAEAQAVIDSLNAVAADDLAGWKTIVEGTYAALSDYDKVVVRTYVAYYEVRTELVAYVDALTGGEMTLPAILAGGEADVSYTNQEAMKQLIMWAGKIAAGTEWDNEAGENDDPNSGKVKLMNGDNSYYPSLRIVSFVEYFKSANVVLPEYVEVLLDTIGYDDFYYGLYYPFYNTVKLAQYIKDNNVTELSALTAEQLAFLNKVWTGGYQLSEQIAWNWNSGSKMEMFYSSRVAMVVSLANGTLENEGTALKLYQYFEIVAQLLTDCGYTVNANGWGVTVATIK